MKEWILKLSNKVRLSIIITLFIVPILLVPLVDNKSDETTMLESVVLIVFIASYAIAATIIVIINKDKKKKRLGEYAKTLNLKQDEYEKLLNSKNAKNNLDALSKSNEQLKQIEKLKHDQAILDAYVQKPIINYHESFVFIIPGTSDDLYDKDFLESLSLIIVKNGEILVETYEIFENNREALDFWSSIEEYITVDSIMITYYAGKDLDAMLPISKNAYFYPTRYISVKYAADLLFNSNLDFASLLNKYQIPTIIDENRARYEILKALVADGLDIDKTARKIKR